jgi:hypothetical protein
MYRMCALLFIEIRCNAQKFELMFWKAVVMLNLYHFGLICYMFTYSVWVILLFYPTVIPDGAGILYLNVAGGKIPVYILASLLLQ